MKHLTIIVTIICLVLLGATVKPAYASQPEADGAAKLAAHLVTVDPRQTKLSTYLTSHNSPLAAYAADFIYQADRHNLDWKLVAAIAGVESTFGKAIPTNSFNAWGWGVFTGASDGVHFKDWADGIAKVSEGLKQNYINRGAITIEQIGRIYAASPAWSWKVHYFLDQIDSYQPTRSEQIEVTL